ncbi:right-handed parallel beta-helix repeat-containing protein [Stakelama saccharophila]|uniref:Right-handed parallel beta-helix repeat-containing protein n=1 Tax=Stakelama saccharophila TaxID=3075605 RepID=A0ABZ0B658_9SPHN|nr:right-handed parallel beta-helix repeat-containing protein [Stakelama sp. W311]WNO52373.1 right-handed parallel beta-helix repeat-containing protein [Stakelama sp. W311]
MKHFRHAGLPGGVALALLFTPLPAVAQDNSPLILHVAPASDGKGAGDAAHPLHSLARAQEEIRRESENRDITVRLADGVYRLDAPLVMGTADGGRDGHSVTWTTEPGARPILSGGIPVSGWALHDAERNIYVADVPRGVDARQLWVNGKIAPRAGIEIARDAVRFTQTGLEIVDPKLRYLADLPQQKRIEVEGTGYFTDRFAPVDHIDGTTITMQQPAWDNNLWGYDTLADPVSPEHSHLYLLNSLAFLQKPDQWYVDPEHGRLYYRPPDGVDPNRLSITLPRLDHLLSIAGTYDPVRNLTFRGIQFSHTSWLGPLTNRGYANQQSGSYLGDAAADYPDDTLESCSFGCRAFETMRNEWSQLPAAVQVARAENVRFDRNVFAHLGQVALGIGMDMGANASHIGLGAQHISVTSNLFTDLAGGAIIAGGVRREAHHPSDPRLVNRDIRIANNRVKSVSREFKDNSAILTTYVDGATIVHNDVSDTPYDAIGTGLGWGYMDVGGNPRYRAGMHGYDNTGNAEYQLPTTLRNTLVAGNRLHDVKQLFVDGGAIYNLSANPHSQIRENYMYDLHGHIGLYLDEGSRGIHVERNVVDGTGRWLNNNTVKSANPMRITIDNKAIGNWHNSDEIGGQWIVYQNDLILDDHPVAGDDWPAEARAVMQASGIEPGKEPPELPAREGAR